jgi:hypothetical protein
MTFLTPDQVAQRYQVSEATLKEWRYKGTGPKFLRLRKRIRYRESDLQVVQRGEVRPLGPPSSDSDAGHRPPRRRAADYTPRRRRSGSGGCVRTPLLGELPRQFLEDFAGSRARVCGTLSVGEFQGQDHGQVALAGDDADRIWPIQVAQRHPDVGGGALKVGLQVERQEFDGDPGGGSCRVHLTHGARIGS